METEYKTVIENCIKEIEKKIRENNEIQGWRTVICQNDDEITVSSKEDLFFNATHRTKLFTMRYILEDTIMENGFWITDSIFDFKESTLKITAKFDYEKHKLQQLIKQYFGEKSTIHYSSMLNWKITIKDLEELDSDKLNEFEQKINDLWDLNIERFEFYAENGKVNGNIWL